MWLSIPIIFTIFGSNILLATSATLEGVNLPETRHVNGVELQMNGHGLRSIRFLGIHVNVYVAGFYTERPLTTEEDVMSCHDSPMQFDFTFLKSVGKNRVIAAWQQQMDYSVTYSYEGYEKDRDLCIEMFSSPIAYGGTQTVQFIGNDTIIIDQGVHKGTIHGRDFQKAFLSMFFGERAVTEELKSSLLSDTVEL